MNERDLVAIMAAIIYSQRSREASYLPIDATNAANQILTLAGDNHPAPKRDLGQQIDDLGGTIHLLTRTIRNAS